MTCTVGIDLFPDAEVPEHVPMPTFIALLRGINVGKAKRVPMAELRALLAGLGYGDVQTLLNSGNAVFTHANASPAQVCEV